MDDAADTLAAKAWLRELRAQRGYTQKELAQAMGVTTRTVINAEDDEQGLPRGLPMIRLLRALGVVADAPLAETDGIAGRLEALEAKVAELPTAKDLHDGLETLRAAIRPEATGGTGATRPAKRVAK